MNIEERLRDAFSQRTESVEVSPGALFEIRHRLDRTRRATRRVPEVRLRPALVMAAAACALVAVLVSVSLTNTASDPPDSDLQVVAPASPGTPVPDPVAPPPDTSATAGPQPPPVASPPPATGTGTPQDGAGQIETVTPVTPPPAPQTSPPPTPPVPPPTPGTEQPDASACVVEPAGGEAPAAWVTVYFACGDDDAAPRRRPAAVNDLATALGVLLDGPNEADIAAGFSGLGSDPDRTASTAQANRWVTIDLPSGLSTSFGTSAAITAEQFLAQLNATVFEFAQFDVAEYRLNGDCAAFGNLLGRSCEVHTRDGGRHVSELTAHTIGTVESVIRAEADDTATSLGVLADGTRLTDGRAGGSGSEWAEVITTAGQAGWVSTKMIVAQPLALDSGATASMVSLARRLTNGPGVESSAFLPGGLVLRWGAGSGAVAVVSTADAGDSSWWDRARDVPSPRDGGTTSSLADLLRIDGEGDSAVVTINAPGPLGEPHADFANLAYVSVYQAAVSRSDLPPELQPASDSVSATGSGTTSEDGDLPPSLPTPPEADSDDEEEPEPLQAQVSVIFDFLSSDGPRVAAVEAIWLEP